MTIDFNSIGEYLSYTKKLGRLTPEELKKLWRLSKKGDFQARQKLIELNLRLVIPIAQRYQNQGLDFWDLVEDGNTGLIRAVEMFNPRRGIQFSTYATYWVEQAIKRSVQIHGPTIRVASSLWKKLQKCMHEIEDIQKKSGYDPTTKELAKKLRMSVDKVKKLLQMTALTAGTTSLDTTIDDEKKISLADIISESPEFSPEKIISIMQVHEEVMAVIKTALTPKEQIVVKMRYGLDGNEPKTLEEISKVLHLTRERIRQIELKALRKLRKKRDLE
ncbi:MAG: RNA polymerase sigma factor RpoD/SigA [Elusimicrobiota bacterium]